ncbi:MAG: hypothetical protein HY560_12925, partial [Gemmatimonadetes bacterium]|nr:hypothetical protein [Gemmatimonadota bacterium]
ISDQDLASLAYQSTAAPLSRLRISWLKLPLTLLVGLASYLVFAVILKRSRGMPDDFMGTFRDFCRKVVADKALDPASAMLRLFLFPSPLDPIGNMPILVNVTSFRFLPWMAALRHMLRRWAPDARPDAVALLCSGTEGVLSAEMGREISKLAGEAGREPAVRDILLRHEPEQTLARLQAEPAAKAFVDRLDAFLAMHGHRALKEFELQSVRWEENPTPVLGMIRNYLLSESDPAVYEEKSAQARADIEREVQRVVGTGLRWRLIRYAAGRARYFLKQRENSRFYHIMGFGAVRKKILAVEAELLQQGKLKCKDDIFFLRLNEIEALRSGRFTWSEVEGRIRERRLEHVRLAKITPPKTIGIELAPEEPTSEPAAADRLVGQAASPGRYAGPARVILDPSADLSLKPGEVLVAPYTDPAWTPLFLTAGAAVIEVGSYLSHAGTVAREFGMPCVVDVADCTRRIRNGVRLDVDGGRGVVHVLDGERKA